MGGDEIGLGEMGKSDRKVGQNVLAEFEKRSRARYALSWLHAECAKAAVSTLLVVTTGIGEGNELSNSINVGNVVLVVRGLFESTDGEKVPMGSGVGGLAKTGSSFIMVVATVVGWPKGPVTTVTVVTNVSGKVSIKG